MSRKKRVLLTTDPRVKILLLVGVNIFVFTNPSISREITVIFPLMILLVLSGLYTAALKSALIYTALVYIQFRILPLSPKYILNTLNILVITSRKLLPCVCLGTLIVKTTPIRLLMHALEKWRIPKSLVIPLAITIRYFPTLNEDRLAIRDAIKLRGIKNPVRKLSYFFVPMILCASATADELSQAITVRGIDSPNKRSCATEIRFHVQDYILTVVSVLLVVLVFVY